MNPNQMIALAVAAGSVIVWMSSKKEATFPDDVVPVDPDKTKPVNPKKMSAFTLQVESLLDACPYATPKLKIEYLTSGKEPRQIVRAEMRRLGELDAPEDDNDEEVPSE
jgi:hypothetical protein|tara:strand:- start:9885 stop:10211 length:327 start_codon:yes stop_codon:yes gene_type:complete